MLEVNLYKGPKDLKGSDLRRMTCISRVRFDREAMGVSVEEFVIGFLRDSLDKMSSDGRDIASLLGDSKYMGRQDLNTINNLLIEQTGFRFVIYTVADDEINPNGLINGDTFEINIVNHNHLQNDYPTVTKMIPSLPLDLPSILHQIVEESGLYNEDNFAGVTNPFTKYFSALDSNNKIGNVPHSIVTSIYDVLSEHGIDVVWVDSEN